MGKRVVRMGPDDAVIPHDALNRVIYKLPANSTLTYAGIVLRAGGVAVPNCAGRITVYRSKDISRSMREIALIPHGYVKTSVSGQWALAWNGEFPVPRDYEYTLEMELRNFTGGSLTMTGSAAAEVNR